MLHNTDFYKTGHGPQYPAGTTMVFSNWTARKSRMEGVDKVVFFGLQAYLQKMVKGWDTEFFHCDPILAVAQYRRRLQNAGITVDYGHLFKLHELGYLPLEIRALPEGTHVPIGVPMFVIWNTHPEHAWLTNYVETSMSANVWGPCTSATIAYQYRRIFEAAAERSGGDKGFVDYQGHDFSYRGMWGDEAAAMSGAGHLLSFTGTDSILALDFLEHYYSGEAETMGGSVAATEHSVMCMGGQDGELETIRRLLTEVHPTGILSIVSDSWDYWKVLTEYLPQLKSEIMARDGKLVVRPDSGDPVKIICGDPAARGPANLGTYMLLHETFGSTRNKAGYMELDPHVGAIYGDSITLDRASAITNRLMNAGFVPNIVLGIGSYTYQYVTRDTFGFALKSTAGVVNGEVREIFKDPITDDGTKKSAKGFTAVYEGADGYYLKDGVALDTVSSCAFDLVMRDGELVNHQTLAQIRARVREGC